MHGLGGRQGHTGGLAVAACVLVAVVMIVVLLMLSH